MLSRVSNLESFRRWRENEDKTAEDFLASLTMEPSEAMLAGTAFHAAMESSTPGEFGVLLSGEYRFNLNIDAEIALPATREIRARKQYGPLVITGKFDALDGRTIIDHKTTARFDAEGYVRGYQWRYYLDIFDGDVFRWNVFEMKATEPMAYDVYAYHQIEQCRYPGMHEDCERLARDFYAFMQDVMPTYKAQLEAA